jgi:large subunit ribosomal protein L6
MSRLASKPELLPTGVVCTINQTNKEVKKSGKAILVPFNSNYINAKLKDSKILFSNKEDAKIPVGFRGLLGITWALFRIALKDLENGHKAKLNLVGVGFKASVVKGGSFSYLKITVGFSHPIFIFIPKGIQVSVEKEGVIISGATTAEKMTFCAKVRSQKKPTVCHGTGVIMNDEIIIKKAGKKK